MVAANIMTHQIVTECLKDLKCRSDIVLQCIDVGAAFCNLVQNKTPAAECMHSCMHGHSKAEWPVNAELRLEWQLNKIVIVIQQRCCGT